MKVPFLSSGLPGSNNQAGLSKARRGCNLVTPGHVQCAVIVFWWPCASRYSHTQPSASSAITAAAVAAPCHPAQTGDVYVPRVRDSHLASQCQLEQRGLIKAAYHKELANVIFSLFV